MNRYHVISLANRKTPEHLERKSKKDGRGRSNKEKGSGMIKVWACPSGFSSLSLDEPRANHIRSQEACELPYECGQVVSYVLPGRA